MNYGFLIDNRKCIGCHACTVACKSEHDVPLGVFRTHVKYVEHGVFPDSRRTFTVHRCNHCEDAPCVDICPTQALFTRADGIVDFDNRRCIGCKSCMQACPYDALYIDPETRTAAKCNYCTHRVDRGYEPACVVVCPVEAIVSGDLNDTSSNIAQLVAGHPTRVRKPEKDTAPNVFYLESDDDAFATELPRTNDNLWASQRLGVGYHARQQQTDADTLDSTQARRVYDTPSKGVLWGWHVPAYITSKAISTGLVLMWVWCYLAEIQLSGKVDRSIITMSMAFLIATGALLVADLARPDRFLYVMLRPNWSSWLVRGGYLLGVFGATLLVFLITGHRSPWGLLSLAALASSCAVYTAFLLAQARGRDLWQSSLMPLHMWVQAIVAGAAALMWLEPVALASDALMVGLSVSLIMILFEVLLPHGSRDARKAVSIMKQGAFAPEYYGSLVLGHILPLVMVYAELGSLADRFAGLLACSGIFLYESARIGAPQRVELS